MTAPLRRVVDRDWLRGRNGGLWDVLDCGHWRAFDGVKRARRRCYDCPELATHDSQPTLCEAL